MIDSTTLLNFNIPVTPALLFGLFGLTLISWIIFTLILRYHWKKYSVDKLGLLKMEIVYFIGSFVLLFLIGSSVLLYSISS